VAIGALYGDMQFMLFPLPIGIKARYLVAIYALVTVAMLFGQQRMYAFAQLGGALAGLLYIRVAPRRGLSFTFSEKWYALRNAAAPRASSRSTCAPRAAPPTSTATAAPSTTTPTTRSAGTDSGSSQRESGEPCQSAELLAELPSD